MSKTSRLRRHLAVTAASAVAASTLLGFGSAQAAPIPAPTHGSTVDYFDDVYTALGAGSVFETVTLERFEYILKTKPGSFAFLIGDPNNASTQATIGHIDAVAKDLGVEKIYNFTPKLDGDKLNIWDLSESNLRTEQITSAGRTVDAGLAQYQAVGDRLLTDYLNKDPQTTFTGDESTDPYLFVYDKDRKAGDDPDRIVNALAGVKTAADLDEPSEQTAYRAQVRSVLESAPDLATNSQFEFNRDEHNRRHFERSVKDDDPVAQADKLARYGGDILDESDNAEGFRVETITYPELVHILKQPGDFPFLFGGTWCHNTAAIIKDTNRLAQEHGIRKVYNFDFSLSASGNSGTDAFHIRDNARADSGTGKVTRPSHLYGDVVNNYLANAVTQYRKTGDAGAGGTNFVSYYPGGDTTQPIQEARKIQVGHVLTYNKDHVDGQGNPAPVVDQAIRRNDDGGNTEHMTEWWFVKGRTLAAGDGTLRGAANPASQSGSDGLQNQRAFAREAIDEIDTVLRGFAGEELASTTKVAVKVRDTEIGSDTLAIGEEPTVEVAVAADGFAPFISLNSSSGSAGGGVVNAPSTGTGKPRGTVELFDGSTSLGSKIVGRDGKASFALPPAVKGSQTLRAEYYGRGELIQPSEKTLTLATGDASTVAVPETTDVRFGAGGELTASVASTVSGTPTGEVTFSGLPGGDIKGTVAGGVARATVPLSTPAGTHSIVARYSGDANYARSVSSAGELTIAKTPATLTQSVGGTKYGQSAQVKIQVTGPGGVVPTGSANVTVAGKTQKVTLDASGRATAVLPKTLTPKKYAVTVVYSGNGNLIARSAFGSVTVAKGAAKTPAFAVSGKVKAKKAGKATVKIATTSGLAKASGKVKVVLKKGKSTKTLNVTVRSGVAAVKLPKLAKGKWSVKVTYLGDSNYVASKTVSKSLSVK